jgi:glycosyltransferase involved in cell wall biosynthesis
MGSGNILVVTATLNQASYLENTLQSVLGQLGSADRYVVIDGGSSDDTHAILERYRRDICCLSVLPGSSHAEALAHGFREPSCSYACYVNSDDLLLPGALDAARAELDANPELVCVYSHRVFIDEHNRVLRIWALPPHNNYLMRRWDYIPQETAVWRASALRDAGGVDPNLDFAVDYDLFLKLMHTGRFRRLSGYLAAFREHGQSKTSLLNDTVGRREVESLKVRHGVEANLADRLIGALLREFVEIRSSVRLTDSLRNTLQQQVQATISG